ncbi:MAG: tRNA uridine-5-carboxymethylaminomethyl(34) synthesis enzyme MnmG, partial [Cucumibacter sp.]
RKAFDLLSYPDVTAKDAIALWPELGALPRSVLDQLAIDAQYAVYLDRQRADVDAVRRDEGRAIPDWVDYGALPGLSNEMRQKLGSARPATIAQAQKLEGVTPAAVTLLLAVIRRGYLTRQAG